jgi:hypothetical protein
MKKFLLILSIVVLLFSCDKKIGSEQLQPQTIASATMDHSLGPTDSLSDWGVMSSESVVGKYWLLGNYSFLYKHFCQLDASPEYPGSVLCGPTSYMLAAHMIASNKGRVYPCSKQKLGAIYNALRNAGKFDNRYGMYINDITWFSTTYDYPVVKTTYMRTARRDVIKGYIEHYLKEGDPVIVPVNVFGLQGSYWANDKDVQHVPGVKYYVSRSGSVGHFILLIGLELYADGSGMAYYKDPLSRNGETRAVHYSRLLDAMLYNGNILYYDALAVFG